MLPECFLAWEDDALCADRVEKHSGRQPDRVLISIVYSDSRFLVFESKLLEVEGFSILFSTCEKILKG